jgi:protein-S-isoprenylcysteine O-methyltransferase Ste14
VSGDTPGVIAPPPLIYLAALAAGYGLERLWPLPFLARPVAHGIGWPLLAAGIALAVWGFREFRRAQTSVNPHKPDSALIVTGPFRYSRNPLYIALALILAGVACLAGSVWTLVMLAPALAIIRTGVIAREERYLERLFGEDYLTYKTRVRRWL